MNSHVCGDTTSLHDKQTGPCGVGVCVVASTDFVVGFIVAAEVVVVVVADLLFWHLLPINDFGHVHKK